MKKYWYGLKHFRAPALCCCLCLSLALAQTAPTQIEIVVVEGEGAVNNPNQRVTTIPVVRVEDEEKRPVPGAAVVFTLPLSGPTGEFSNGSKTLTTMTDDKGLASAQGLKANPVGGKLQIYVTASYKGLRARGLVNQVNQGDPNAKVQTSRNGHGKLLAILLVVGAAAAGGAVAATHGGSSSGSGSPNPPSTISITPGTGSITPPR